MKDEQVALARHFDGIGAKVRFQEWSSARGARAYDVGLTRRERRGDQAFLISTLIRTKVEFTVLAHDRADRHLLLMVRLFQGGKKSLAEKHCYLCGHDERDWFVAAIPSMHRSVRDIGTAKDALKPDEVLQSEHDMGLRLKDRHKRRNNTFLRQGEWFFMPAPMIQVSPLEVLRDEPLRRGMGKPHIAQFAFRNGGTTVYVCRSYPNGLEAEAYKQVLLERPELKRAGWRVMRKDPRVFCKGKIRHPDHATINLPAWHRVLPNREDRAPWMEHLSFLD